MSEIVLTAPSGRSLAVTLGDQEPMICVHSGFDYALGPAVRTWQIGARGYHDATCREMVAAFPRWREVVLGNELVVSSTIDDTVTVATLIGKYHELQTIFGGPAPSLERIVSIFVEFIPEDSPAGMCVRPTTGSLGTIFAQWFNLAVANRGILRVPGPESASALVPSWQGAPTKYGELWQKIVDPGLVLPGSPVPSIYVLGCPRGAAQITLFSETAGTEPIANWLDGCRVSWL